MAYHNPKLVHLRSNWDQHGVYIQGYWSNIMHFMCCVFRIQIWLPHFKIQAPFRSTIWISKLHFIVNKYNVQLRNNLHSWIHLQILIQWNTGYLGQELSAQLDIKLPPFRNCNDNTSQSTTTADPFATYFNSLIAVRIKLYCSVNFF